MAIKKERLASLINAATDYRDKLYELYEHFTEDRNNNRLTGDQYALMGVQISQIILELGNKYNAVISEEQRTFAKNYSRNVYMQRVQEKARREAGVQPRPYIPSILNTMTVLRTADIRVDHTPRVDTELPLPKLTDEQVAQLVEEINNPDKTHRNEAVRKTLYLEDDEEVETGNPSSLFVGDEEVDDE